jgi:glutaminyl-peptide cyclotransferase
VNGLNELECVGGDVFANVFRQRRIARIDATSGQLRSWLDTGGILFTEGVGGITGIDVLNGIAYVPERERFLITGKYWPRVFEVEFPPESP